MALSAATVSLLFPASMRICVSVTRCIDALVLVIFPLQGRLPEIALTVEDVTIIDGHHLVAGDLDQSSLRWCRPGSEPRSGLHLYYSA